MEWLEGDISLKNPVTPPVIDPGTVRLVAQRLNHYGTPGLGMMVTLTKCDVGSTLNFRPLAVIWMCSCWTDVCGGHATQGVKLCSSVLKTNQNNLWHKERLKRIIYSLTEDSQFCHIKKVFKCTSNMVMICLIEQVNMSSILVYSPLKFQQEVVIKVIIEFWA